MTTEEIIAMAKEKLGKDITEQEAQDYLSGKAPLPDEALELVSGGGVCDGATDKRCPVCGFHLYQLKERIYTYHCKNCKTHLHQSFKGIRAYWDIFGPCPKCQLLSYYRETDRPPYIYKCRTCGYTNQR